MPTITELGQKVKSKYPGEYDDLADEELGRRVKAKYPGEYDDFTDTLLKENKSFEHQAGSAVEKTIRAGESILGGQASAIAKGPIASIANMFANPEAKAKIEALRKSKKTAYASDVLEQVIPGLKHPEDQAKKKSANLLNIPIMSMIQKMLPSGAADIARTGTRLAADVALDPLTYETFGEGTAYGKIANLVREAGRSGQKIKLDEKIGQMIAKEMGATKATPEMVRKFKMKVGKVGPKNFSGQVSAGERSLAKLGPLELTGKIPGKILAPLSNLRRGEMGAKIEQAARDLLSTKSGDPDFDVLHDKMHSLLEYRLGLRIDDAKLMNKQAEDLTRALGIPREKLNSEIRRIGEEIKVLTPKQAKMKYEKETFDKIAESYNTKIVEAKVALENHKLGLRYATAKLMSRQSGVPLSTKYKSAKILSPEQLDLASRQLVDNQSSLNMLTGKYAPPPSISPEIDKIVNEHREALSQDLIREQTAGVHINNLVSDRYYIPRIMHPEVRESMKQMAIREGKLPDKMSSKEWDEHLTNSIHRQFNEVNPTVVDAWKESGLVNGTEARALKGKSGTDYAWNLLDKGKITEGQFEDVVHSLGIDDINSLPKADKLKIFGTEGKLNKQTGQYEIFHTDPIYYTTIRGMRGEVARTAAEFYTEMKVRELALPEGKQPPNWVKVRPAELADHYVSPEVARVINKMDEFKTNPDVLNKVLRGYDKYYKLHKLWTILPFSAYHILNTVGNFWNNFLAGVTDIGRYGEAAAVQATKLDPKYRPVNFKDIFGNKWNNEKILDSAKKLGVVGRGEWGVQDQTIKQALEKGKILTFSSRSHVLRTGMRVGKYIEDNARLAHFIDRLKKGDSAEQAAMSVKKFLFDYGDLTNFEREKLNRFFFFYTWTRKNLPLQLHSLVTQPAKFALPFKAKNEIEKNTPLVGGDSEQYLADYYKDSFPIRVKYDSKTETYKYFLLNKWLPSADILKLAHLHEVAANMLSPLPKEALQQLWNRDIYTGKKLEDFAGETAPFLGMQLPKRVIHGAKLIRMLNEIDKLTGSEKDTWDKTIGMLGFKNASYDPVQSRYINSTKVDEEMNMLLGKIYSEKLKPKPNQKQIDHIIDLIRQAKEKY